MLAVALIARGNHNLMRWMRMKFSDYVQATKGEAIRRGMATASKRKDEESMQNQSTLDGWNGRRD
jgi:hypothetical protein